MNVPVKIDRMTEFWFIYFAHLKKITIFAVFTI